VLGKSPESTAARPYLARGGYFYFPRLVCPFPQPTPTFTSHSNPCPQDESTPLHLASSSGHEAACRVLIEAGAEVNA